MLGKIIVGVLYKYNGGGKMAVKFVKIFDQMCRFCYDKYEKRKTLVAI